MYRTSKLLLRREKASRISCPVTSLPPTLTEETVPASVVFRSVNHSWEELSSVISLHVSSIMVLTSLFVRVTVDRIEGRQGAETAEAAEAAEAEEAAE